MGLLRFLLALAVILEHTSAGSLWGLKLTGGTVAVQTFFIISGFYMALILNEKYIGAGSYRLFITNRLLRLLPAYWMVLIVTIIFTALAWMFLGKTGKLQLFASYWGGLDISTKVFLVFANIGLVGQDWAMFLGLDTSGLLYPVADFHQSVPPLHSFLFVPQAWSLGVELTFYLMAPFVVTRSAAAIFCFAFLAVCLRYDLYAHFGLFNDPWNYRFFPTELALFLMGALSYKLYVRIRNLKLGIMPLAASCLLLFVTASFQFLPDYLSASHFNLKIWLFYVFAATAIPLAFICTKNISPDRYIGEMSYPAYISHILVIGMAKGIGIEHPALVVAGTVIVSILLFKYLIEPIDHFRDKRLQLASAQISTAST
jgi:peptidoglycan/LPS O-acetylase OafA/YrhL